MTGNSDRKTLSGTETVDKRRYVVMGNKPDLQKVQRAKDLRRAMTYEEARLWQALRRNSLMGLHFRRQQVIAGYIVDFYCHSAGLAVEVDGELHAEQAEYDRLRDNALLNLSVRTLRIPNREVREDLTRALMRIIEAASSVASHPLPDGR